MGTRQFILIVFVLLSMCSYVYASVTNGYIKEFTLSEETKTPIHSINEKYEYYIYKNTLLLNPFNTSEIIINDLNIDGAVLTYSVSNATPQWRYYKGKSNFGITSNTSSIVEKEIFFPDCILGNICNINKFSVRLPNVSLSNSNNVKFYINNIDVTTLFHYENGVFKVKKYYEEHFYSKFKDNKGIFSWKLSERSKPKSVTLTIGSKSIYGKVLNEKNKPFTHKAKVKLTYAGSNTIIPHTFYVDLNSDGTYFVDNLATFDYKISLDIWPNANAKIEGLSEIDNKTKLSLVHTLPEVDEIFYEPLYRAGEFLIFEPSKWGFKEKFVNISQKGGDSVSVKFNKERVAILLPIERKYEDDIVLYVELESTNFLLIIPSPVPIDDGYTQFGVFDEKGVYAKTKMWNFYSGGVVAEPLMPKALVDSSSLVNADDVKVHYYDRKAKAVDVTHMFTFNEKSQVLSGNDADFENFYKVLDSSGTLAVTFCDKAENCFRTKENVRPSVAAVTVNVKAEDKNFYKNKFLVLRELHILENPLVKVLDMRSEISTFNNIPSGLYQVQLLDLDLKYYGSGFIEVKPKNDLVTVNITPLKVEGFSQSTLNLITKGKLVELADNKVILYPNDFHLIDLNNFIGDSTINITKVKILGKLPAEHRLYSDNTIAIMTGDDERRNEATLMFEANNFTYLLPLLYVGNDYVMVNEIGQDYTMCPNERPYCINAFVAVGGVSQGIYNGKYPLRVTFPLNFKLNEVKVYMESDVDVTNMFWISSDKSTVTLKKALIPSFLSNLATNTKPITFKIKDREYEISLIAGYKSVEASVVDQFGAQSSAFAGLKARISCQYAEDKYFSQITDIKGTGLLTFNDLPDCVYDISLIDHERLFYGEVSDLRLTVGDNMLRTVFPVHCVGSNDQFIENCQPFLPLVHSNLLISPYLGVIFTEKNVGKIDRIKVEGNISAKYYEKGIILYSPPVKEVTNSYLDIFSNGNENKVTLVSEPFSKYLTRVVEKPKDIDVSVASVSGVDSAFIYSGEAFVIKLNTPLIYSVGEITATIVYDNKENLNITRMFLWNSKNRTLTLKVSNRLEFLSKLGYRQQVVKLEFAPQDPERYTVVEVVIGAAASDINVNLNFENNIKKFEAEKTKALLIGTESKNGFEFRQLADVKRDGYFKFTNIPFGLYDIVVFDQSNGVYGHREIMLQDEQSDDVYIELQLRQFE